MGEDVLVCGATGRVGGATLRALADRGVRAAALVRGPQRAALADHVRVGDFADPASLDDAFAGVDRLLLCSAHGPTMERDQLAAVAAAERAGVRHVVKVSASPATIFRGTPAEAAAAHLAVEEALRASGMRSVCVRPNAFMQFLLGFGDAMRAGVLPLPLGDAAVSWVDAEDVGRVCAALLLAGGSGDEVVEVTGPEALSVDALAGRIASVAGRRVRGEAVTDEAARAAMRARGLEPWFIEHVLGVFALFRARDAGRVTDAVERLTGSPATALDAFLAAQRAVLFPHAPEVVHP